MDKVHGFMNQWVAVLGGDKPLVHLGLKIVLAFAGAFVHYFLFWSPQGFNGNSLGLFGSLKGFVLFHF